MIWGLLALLVLVNAWALYALRERGRRYEQIISILETERDAARQEAKVFRNLLFPVMAKVDGSRPEPTPKLTSREVAQSGKPLLALNPLLNRAIPFRLRFKQALKTFDSKQQKTDALASALEKQKPSQEKQNATA